MYNMRIPLNNILNFVLKKFFYFQYISVQNALMRNHVQRLKTHCEIWSLLYGSAKAYQRCDLYKNLYLYIHLQNRTLLNAVNKY